MSSPQEQAWSLLWAKCAPFPPPPSLLGESHRWVYPITIFNHLCTVAYSSLVHHSFSWRSHNHSMHRGGTQWT